jgi:hypothetical protein
MPSECILDFLDVIHDVWPVGICMDFCDKLTQRDEVAVLVIDGKVDWWLVSILLGDSKLHVFLVCEILAIRLDMAQWRLAEGLISGGWSKKGR